MTKYPNSMDSLRALAARTAIRCVKLPSGNEVGIAVWSVQFESAEPSRLVDPQLPKTYTIKPLVQLDGEPLFGELAILRCLQKDGWDGVWVDTFHRRFWQGLPDRTEPYDLASAPTFVRATYDRIVSIRGKSGGFFDVMAWRGNELFFIEYKGKGDRPNSNESSWIEAALEAGIDEHQLLFVASA